MQFVSGVVEIPFLCFFLGGVGRGGGTAACRLGGGSNTFCELGLG